MSREIFEIRCQECSTYIVVPLDISKDSRLSLDCPRCQKRTYLDLRANVPSMSSQEPGVTSDGPVNASLVIQKLKQSKENDEGRKHLLVMRSASSMLPQISKYSKKKPGALVDALCMQPPLEAFNLRFVRQPADRIQIYDDDRKLAFQGSFSQVSKTWNMIQSTVRSVGIGFKVSLGVSKEAPLGMRPAALVVGKSSDGWFVVLEDEEPSMQPFSKEMSVVGSWLSK